MRRDPGHGKAILVAPAAIIGALDAHTPMSTQALNSERVRAGLKGKLLDHAGVYEGLRGEGAGG